MPPELQDGAVGVDGAAAELYLLFVQAPTAPGVAAPPLVAPRPLPLTAPLAAAGPSRVPYSVGVRFCLLELCKEEEDIARPALVQLRQVRPCVLCVCACVRVCVLTGHQEEVPAGEDCDIVVLGKSVRESFACRPLPLVTRYRERGVAFVCDCQYLRLWAEAGARPVPTRKEIAWYVWAVRG